MSGEDVFSRYDWEPGECFRHPELGEMDTARIEVLHPRGGGEQEVRACRLCIAEMEMARERAVERSHDADRGAPDEG